MSKRTVTQIRVEVACTLPAGKSVKWALDWLKGTLAQERVRAKEQGLDAPFAETVRLVGKETTYL